MDCEFEEKGKCVYALRKLEYEGCPGKDACPYGMVTIEWMKELEENAKKDIYMSPGELKGYTPQVGYLLDKDYSNPAEMFLNGTFTAEQLETLAQHMRKHSTDPNQQSIPDP